jgi:hypothetical protein
MQSGVNTPLYMKQGTWKGPELSTREGGDALQSVRCGTLGSGNGIEGRREDIHTRACLTTEDDATTFL